MKAKADIRMHYARRAAALAGLLALFLVFGSAVRGAPGSSGVAGIFGDNMVLQRGGPIPVWGWAPPGTTMAVRFVPSGANDGTLSQKKSATTDASGKWMVMLDAMPACTEPCTLVIESDPASFKFQASNVLMGDVWLCSGQSNMERPVNFVNGAAGEIRTAHYPAIRYFDVPSRIEGIPAANVSGRWTICASNTAPNFSAVAYFFGRELYRELGVPIGLIKSAHGGTLIEPWIPAEGFASVPALRDTHEKIQKFDAQYIANLGRVLDEMEAWVRNTREALASGKPGKPAPTVRHACQGYSMATALYNGMIAPLVPFAIRGVIWYQGESNCMAGDGMIYGEKMAALINGWRTVWRQRASSTDSRSEFPFYFVQLAPFRYNLDPLQLPKIREAQAAALAVTNTGMICTMDIGYLPDAHPRNKQAVGKRLALLALAKTYGRSELVFSGPVFRSMDPAAGKIRIRFDHVGSGLASRDGKELTWFEIAGADRHFEKASARIDGETVVVWHVAITNPVAVRFGFHQEAEPNLMNSEGLPAFPFRTDQW